MDIMPAKTDDLSVPEESLTRLIRPAKKEEDVALSELKMDRETRLRRISADRTFRSRHLNAVADRKLHLQTHLIEKATHAEGKTLRKERQTIQKELFSIHREKSLSVDEHLEQVKERSEKRRTSKVRDRRSTPSMGSVIEQNPTESKSLSTQSVKDTEKETNNTRSRRKAVSSSPLQLQ